LSYQVEGLVRDNRVEVRVLFCASSEAPQVGALVVLGSRGRAEACPRGRPAEPVIQLTRETDHTPELTVWEPGR
jgi:hypothetical protein